MPKKFVNYLTNVLTKKRREPNDNDNNKLVTDAAALPNVPSQTQVQQQQQQRTIIDVDHESSSSTNIGNVTNSTVINETSTSTNISGGGDITTTSTTTTDAMSIDNNNIGNSTEMSQQLATINHAAMPQPPPPELHLNNINNTITNTALSLNNPQAQRIYQITNSKGIHIGDEVVIQINNNNNTTTNNKPFLKLSPMINKTKKHKSGCKHGGSELTSTINAMMKSKCELELKSMNIISEHLGGEWQSVFRHLGYSQGQIEQHIMDINIPGIGRTREAIYQLLLDAHNNDMVTLGSISQILWEYNHKEVVFKLKEYWKPLYIASKLAAKAAAASTAAAAASTASAAASTASVSSSTSSSSTINQSNELTSADLQSITDSNTNIDNLKNDDTSNL